MKEVIKIAFSLYCLLTYTISNSQVLFHQNLCHCGVTGAGFSTSTGSGSGSFDIYIEPGSTIKKAWLFAQRFGEADSVSIIMNGVNYNFNDNNQVTPDYFINFDGYSAIHAIDITANINPTVTNYNIAIPTQTNITIPADSSIADANIKYGAVYLWIEYLKPTLPLTNSVVLLNNYSFDNNPTTNYQVDNISPINTNKPIGFATYTDRLGDTLNQLDGSYIYIYNDLLGLIGGTDAVDNLWAGGVKGHYYYQNDSLFGLDDDTPDSLMAASDGLADISSYLTNSDTSFSFKLKWQNSGLNSSTNFYQGFFLTYTTPCDTFTTTVTANDTICLGESVQLQATGGVEYSWFGAFGGLSDTSIATPIASPPQTTTYIVTIKNDSGCVKTEQVKIWVQQPIDSVTTKPTTCGAATGSLTAHNTGNFNFVLYNSLNTAVGSNTTGVFNQLSQGNYVLQSSVNTCTFYDTVNVGYTILTQSVFSGNPFKGIAPLAVNFTNFSTTANQYTWLLPTDTFYTQHLTHTFTTGGVYPVCLVAQNNLPHCVDTACFTYIVDPNITIIIPNVFTPNGDNNNDNFVIQITGANLIEELKVEIFNRWGQRVASREFEEENTPFNIKNSTLNISVWDGKTTAAKNAPEGTYYYVINYTTDDDGTSATLSEQHKKGSVTLLR